MPKNFRARRESSSSESNDDESDEQTKQKIEDLKFAQNLRKRTHGIDLYSLAIGESDETVSAADKILDNDPWKSKTGGLVDMRKIKEKRGNEIVKNMHSNFAKETNQRDEDAEMQKFIEEQLRLKKEQEKKESGDTGNSDSGEPDKKKFKTPQDALFDVPKYLIESTSKHKSEESLSEQMLSGIPEVDLGIEERIKNIERTEQAKQQLKSGVNSGASGSSTMKRAIANDSQYAPHNTSVNFVQHKRFDDALINPDHMIKPKMPNNKLTGAKNDGQPVVGDAPKHELLQQQPQHPQKQFNKPNKTHHRNTTAPKSDAPASTTNKSNNKNSNVERASDDYCLERFKKNMRFSRNSKIKIA